MFNEHLKKFYILYDLRIKKMKQTDIAKERGVNKDTVTNVKKKYSFISDEELMRIYESQDKGYIYAYFGREREKTITDREINAIKKVCLETLNCYYSPEEFCGILCYQKDVKFKDVYKYNPSNIDIDVNSDISREDYRRKIYSIRKRTSPIKNFSEAYEEFKETEEYKINEMSYSSFYNIAREFWKKPDWQGEKLGDVIDKKIIKIQE